MTRLSIVFLVGLSLASITGAQKTERGAKELFYDPSGRDVTSVSHVRTEVKTEQTTVRRVAAPPRDDHGRRLVTLPAADATTERPAVLGLSYWIELETPGAGSGVQVTEHRIFRSGERIRLHFRSNADGHVSILQLGASGTAQLLFPDAGKGLTATALEANAERILPSDAHWFRFDDNPGTERLIVLFARNHDEIEGLPIRPQMDRSTTESFLRTASHLRGSKDLVIETETQNTAEIGTYGVNLAGQPVVLEIVLEHR